jgi:hypothetical protein
LVPFLFVGMIASLIALTLGSTCLDDYRRRGDAPRATAGDRDLSGRGGPVRIPCQASQGWRHTGRRHEAQDASVGTS